MANEDNTFQKRLAALSDKINYRYVVWGITLLLVAGAVVFGARRGWAELQRQPEFNLSTDAPIFSPPPPSVRRSPMEETLRAEVRVAVRNATIFDEDICGAVAHELLASPWIIDVTHVRRMYPNRLHVKAQFRRPAGMVETDRYRHMVDRWGYWLPKKLYRQPDKWNQIDIPTIIDESLSSLPERGEQWNGPGLAVGASLTQILIKSNLLDELPITHIDVSNVGSDGTASEVVLRTAANRDIKWGTTEAYKRIEGISRPADARTDAEKIAMLRSMLQKHPNLMGLHYVDLRFGKIYYK